MGDRYGQSRGAPGLDIDVLVPHRRETLWVSRRDADRVAAQLPQGDNLAAQVPHHDRVDLACFTTGVAVVASGLVTDGYHVGDEPRRYRFALLLYLPPLLNHAVDLQDNFAIGRSMYAFYSCRGGQLPSYLDVGACQGDPTTVGEEDG